MGANSGLPLFGFLFLVSCFSFGFLGWVGGGTNGCRLCRVIIGVWGDIWKLRGCFLHRNTMLNYNYSM